MPLRISKKIIYTGGSLLLIVFGIYYVIGGFDKKIEMQLIDNSEYVIAGKYFQGKYNSDTLQHLFQEANSYINNGQLEGVLTVVNFNEDETKRGQVKQLIGIATDNLKYATPKNWSVDTFRAAQTVRAVIHSHPWVRPKPGSVNEAIRNYAQENAMELADYTIEQYVSEKEIWVDTPVIENN